MTLSEKRQLVNLLHKYQDEQIGTIMDNKQEIENAKFSGVKKWELDLNFGNKAQYEHARIIATRLSKQINDELPSYYDY